MLALVALLEVGYSGPLVQRPGRCDVQMVNVKGPTNALLNDMVGASTEISDKIWDPFDLAGSADQANLNLLRAAELKPFPVAITFESMLLDESRLQSTLSHLRAAGYTQQCQSGQNVISQRVKT